MIGYTLDTMTETGAQMNHSAPLSYHRNFLTRCRSCCPITQSQIPPGACTCSPPFWFVRNVGTSWRAIAAVDRAAVRRKLSRLKELYLNEVIDLDEYKRDYESLSAQLEERQVPPPAPQPNFEAVEAFLAQDFRQIYDTLEREEKRTLWRSIIKEIRIDNDQQVKGLSFL